MKIITINIAHDEVFKDFIEQFEDTNSKYMEFHTENDSATINITGTLEELENE